MRNDTLKTILTLAVLVLGFIVVIQLLKFAIKVLLPIAILVIAAYIVYSVIKRKRI